MVGWARSTRWWDDFWWVLSSSLAYMATFLPFLAVFFLPFSMIMLLPGDYSSAFLLLILVQILQFKRWDMPQCTICNWTPILEDIVLQLKILSTKGINSTSDLKAWESGIPRVAECLCFSSVVRQWANSTFLFLFLSVSPSTIWRMPTHIGQGFLVYSVH
jgi:hypothetical protein